MASIFKFNNKLYQAMNLDKKLKRLKINKEDIDIIYNADVTKQELENKYIQLIGGEKKELITNTEYVQSFYRYVNPNNKYDNFLSDVNEPIKIFKGKKYENVGRFNG